MLETAGKSFVNCVKRSYLVESEDLFNDMGRSKLYRVALKPSDRDEIELDNDLLFKDLAVRELLSWQNWPDEISHLERLIATGMDEAYGRSRKSTFFARNIAFPIDYTVDSGGRLNGVVVPRAPSHMYRRPRYEGDLRPQTFGHLILDAQAGKFGPNEIMPVVRKLSGAVNKLHRAGFVHGDISANNILCSVRPKASVLLVDTDGANDLALRHGEFGSTLHWRDPRLDAKKINVHDEASDDYMIAIVALRVALLDSEADASTFRRERARLERSVSSRLFELLALALDNPLDTSARPTAFDWLERTTDLDGRDRKIGRRPRSPEFEDLAAATLVDHRVGSIGKRARSSGPKRPSVFRRPADAWRASRAQRSQLKSSAESAQLKARRGLLAATFFLIVGLASASDPETFSLAATRLALHYLPWFGGAWGIFLVSVWIGIWAVQFSSALLGPSPSRSFVESDWQRFACVGVAVGAPLGFVARSAWESSNHLYVPPSTTLIALAYFPAILLFLALIRSFVALTADPVGRFRRMLFVLEFLTILGLALVAGSVAASSERVQADAVYDTSAAFVKTHPECRLTGATRPGQFRQWRASDVYCSEYSVHARVTGFTSSAATTAFAKNRRREVDNRSGINAEHCSSRRGLYKGSYSRGDLICYSQGRKSVIESSDLGENRYIRVTGRMSRAALTRTWRRIR